MAQAQAWRILLAILALVLAGIQGWRPGQTVLALAAAGFLIAALAQAKGYSYHFYPVSAFTLLSLALAALDRGPPARAGALGAGVLAVTLAAQSAAFLAHRSAGGDYGRLTACLVGQVRAEVAPEAGFMALSTHPFPGFPVANHAGREWVAATNSRLFLPAIVRLRARDRLTAPEARVLARAERHERAAVLADLARRPQLVFVDARTVRHAIGRRPADFLAFYKEDPAFATIWANYRETDGCHPGLRSFVLERET